MPGNTPGLMTGVLLAVVLMKARRFDIRATSIDDVALLSNSSVIARI
jgi:hypothetical protein